MKTTAETPQAVVLVGFMGAGKTTVGQALARRLGWQFVDLDDRIIARNGRSIAAIFRESGEEEFRRLETASLRELLDGSRRKAQGTRRKEEAASSKQLAARKNKAGGTVIALGGGAISRAGNARMLKRARLPVIFLDAPLEELRRRCAQGGDLRPLYRDQNQFRQLYESRRGGYMKAGLRVETQAKSVEQVAAEVAALLQLGGP